MNMMKSLPRIILPVLAGLLLIGSSIYSVDKDNKSTMPAEKTKQNPYTGKLFIL